MKLATLKNGKRDGKLVVVNRELSAAVEVADIASTLQEAMDERGMGDQYCDSL